MYHHPSILRFPLITLLVCIGLAAFSGCASFQSRVKDAQVSIENSFQDIGYTPRDAITFRATPREMKGRQWVERTVRFRDKQDRTWQELHKFFRNNPKYNFEYYLTVGESESDLEKIRWFEFKIDQLFCIYRVEFVRSRLAGMLNEPAPAAPVMQRVPQTESYYAP